MNGLRVTGWGGVRGSEGALTCVGGSVCLWGEGSSGFMVGGVPRISFSFLFNILRFIQDFFLVTLFVT